MNKEILKKNLKAFRRNAYFWYRKHGYAAFAALDHAKTQVILDLAQDSGTVQIKWEYDSDWEGPEAWGWSKKDIERWNRTDHECLGCVLEVHGEHEESLWGIFDPSNTYRKIVENELMQQFLYRKKGLLPNYVD